MKNLLFSVILAIFMTGISYSQDLLWSRSEIVNSLPIGRFVKTDAYNNVYVGAIGPDRMYMIKYDQDGTEQFLAGDNNTNSFNGMVLTNEGRSFLAGSRYNAVTNRDGLIHVYEPDGSELYTQYYNFIDEVDEFRDIFVDDNGNAYITGESHDIIDRYALTIKYSPTGAPQWIQRYGSIMDRYLGLKINVNSSGESFVSGTLLKNASLTTDVFMIKYDADGNLISEFEDNMGGYEACTITFALLDDEDNLFLGGILSNMTMQSIGFVIRVSSGNLIWTKIITSPDDQLVIYDGAFDASGNIIIGGAYSDGNTDAYYAGISPTGALLFEKTYNGIGNGTDTFTKLITKDEFTYLCGASTGIGTSVDYIILKVNTAGEEMWEAHYNGFGNGDDMAYDIVLDNEDNVIVTGTSAEQGGQYCTTMKFSNPLGIHDGDIPEIKTPVIYPNPANAILYIDYEADSDDTEYSISDFSGRIISSGILRKSPVQKIDISNYSSGIYLIRINDGSKYFNAKFVKK